MLDGGEHVRTDPVAVELVVGVILRLARPVPESTEHHEKADDAAGDDQGDAPSLHDDGALLRAIREVVVARGHVEERLRIVHDHRPRVKVAGRRVELLAIRQGIVVVPLIGVNLIVAPARGLAGREIHILVEVRQLPHEPLGADVRPVRAAARAVLHCVVAKAFGLVLPERRDLDNVGAVGHATAVAGVTGRVGVGACPLEMDALSLPQLELVGHKVVLHRWVHLHDVAAAAAHVEIVDNLLLARVAARPAADLERVRSVLEGAPVLIRVRVQLERIVRAMAASDSHKVAIRVVINQRGRLAVLVRVDVPTVEIASGDVVAHAKDARGLTATGLIEHVVWNLPTETRRTRHPGELPRFTHHGDAVAKVIVARERCPQASRPGRTPLAKPHPLPAISERLIPGAPRWCVGPGRIAILPGWVEARYLLARPRRVP
mmetsp:Transcript_4275/g.11143  ORF Transcript_4275/g.11143 Transcript_4275/m.11143 type:complete len:433 (-) Transcript_4275:792-2090(-)